MTWRATERRKARNYIDKDESTAFLTGYSDGYNGYPKGAGVDKDWFPNAYSAGYWDGVGDKNDVP